MIDTDDTIEIENQDNLELTAHPHQMGTETQVRITKEQSSIFELLRREERGDLVLAPDFQRKNVWDRKHQSELIESILMGIPIPLIYLFEDEEGVRLYDLTKSENNGMAATLALFKIMEVALSCEENDGMSSKVERFFAMANCSTEKTTKQYISVLGE